MTLQQDTSQHVTLWKACYDQNTHDVYAVVLLPGLDREPVPFCPGTTNRDELVAKVQETYGTEAIRVAPARFNRAVLRRKTHRPYLLEQLSPYHALGGDDVQTFVVYGSRSRPLSMLDIRPLAIYGAISLPAEKNQDGYYNYIVVPQFLPEEQERAYDLDFISRPLVMNGEA